MSSTIVAWAKVLPLMLLALVINGPLWLTARAFEKLAKLLDRMICRNAFQISKELADKTINKRSNARYDKKVGDFIDRLRNNRP